MKRTYNEIEAISQRLHNLKASHQLDDAALRWSIDRQGVHIDITLVRRGVEKRVACVVGSDGVADMVENVMHKVSVVLR